LASSLVSCRLAFSALRRRGWCYWVPPAPSFVCSFAVWQAQSPFVGPGPR